MIGLKYYVYRHIRLDKNVPFYIGIGTLKNKFGYYRAFCSTQNNSRSSYWLKIFSKTIVEVEIIYESDNYEDVIAKEVEFINLYKRKEEGGSLCNLSAGGEGAKGVKGRFKPETIKALQERGKFNCGDIHACSILNESQVIDIIKRYNSGERLIEINEIYPNVTKTAIHRIFKKKNWKHLSYLIDNSVVRRFGKKVNESEIIELYLAGTAIYLIAKKFHIDKPKVVEILIQNSVERLTRKKLYSLKKISSNAVSK